MYDEYRKNRAEGYRAADALRHARYRKAMSEAEFPRYTDEPVTMPLPGGERIVMRLEPDGDADIAERFGATIEYSPDRWPRDYDAPDWWQDREGRFYYLGDRYGDRYVVEFNYCNRDYHHKRGMSRHDAWLAARADRERAASAFREAYNMGYLGYVVTLYDAKGEEVAQDSCWGFEGNDDAAGEAAYEAAQALARHRAEERIETLTAARATAINAARRANGKARDVLALLRRIPHRTPADTREAACRLLRAFRGDAAAAWREADRLAAERAIYTAN